MSGLGAMPRHSPLVTRVSALTRALLQSERLVSLLPWSVVRQLVEAGQLAVIGPDPPLPDAQPLGPIGLMLPQDGASVAVRVFAGFLEHSARHPPAGPDTP